MPGKIIEVYKSGAGSESENPDAHLLYVVMDTFDDEEVRTLIEDEAPDIYLGLNLSNYDFRPLGNGLWDAAAHYGLNKAEGEVAVSFDTTGGTAHYTQSLQTISRYAIPGTTAPDFSGAIGVDGDRVNGVDAPAPSFKFQLSKRWPKSPITDAYILQLAELTPGVNASQFRQFAAGTLLCLGATGSQRGREMWDITYYFAFSKNVTSLTMGGITGISKKGWEYLWWLYRDIEDTAGKIVVKRPIAAFVERLTTEVDFGLFNI